MKSELKDFLQNFAAEGKVSRESAVLRRNKLIMANSCRSDTAAQVALWDTDVTGLKTSAQVWGS